MELSRITKRISVAFFVLGIILLAITSLSLIFSLTAVSPTLTTSNISEEQYSPDIATFRTLREFEDMVAIEIDAQGLSGIEIPILIDDYLRKKFYHGYSVKRWHDNWVLAFVNTMIPQYYLSGNMRQDDIFQYDYGICSQQAIVFQVIVGDFGFDYGSVRFSAPDFGHFASAVRVNGEWYYFDQNLEPEYDRTSSNIFDQIILGNEQILTDMYGNHFDDITDDMIELTDINTFPASRGVLAQTVTYVLSWYGWAFLVFPSIAALLYRRRTQQSGDAEPRDSNLPNL